MAQQMFRPIAAAVPSSDDVALREQIAALLAKQASAPRDMPAGTSTNQAIGHGGIQLVQALMARNARDTAVESKNQYRDHLAKTNEPLVDSLTGGDEAKRDLVAKAIAGMNPEVANQALSTNALNRALAVPDPALALRRDELQGARDDRELARSQRMQELQMRLADGRTRAEEAAGLRRELAGLAAETARRGQDATSQAAKDKAEAAAKAKETTVTTGKSGVASITSSLRDMYGQLQDANGITNTEDGALANVAAGIASSGPGQFAGRLLGTQSQSNRNTIKQQRPLLLQAIKSATGMSSQQMNSNVELKLFLEAATDPGLDYQANMRALDKIDELYGDGVPKAEAPTAPTAPTDLAAAAKAELARRRGGPQ